MKTRTALSRPRPGRGLRDLDRSGMALFGGGRSYVPVEFGRGYGRSSGYGSGRRYLPRTSPALFRFR